MIARDKELRVVLKSGIKTLILQEVRLLGLKQGLTPRLILDEMNGSIQETKKTIIRMTRAMHERENGLLLKRMIRKAVDDEIDHAIALRKTRCVRCLYGRFYDREETAHVNLPVKEQSIESIGCNKLRPSLRKNCRHFAESSAAVSLEGYLNELVFLYEFRDLINRIEEVWKDYLIK